MSSRFNGQHHHSPPEAPENIWTQSRGLTTQLEGELSPGRISPVASIFARDATLATVDLRFRIQIGTLKKLRKVCAKKKFAKAHKPECRYRTGNDSESIAREKYDPFGCI